MDPNPYQPPTTQAANPTSYLDLLGSNYYEPWYLRYPRSSGLAILAAGAVTVTAHTGMAILCNGLPGEVLPAVVAFLLYVVLIVGLFLIMWFFQTGFVTSLAISLVMYLHAAMIAIVVLYGLAGAEYDFPQVLSVLPFLCLAVPVAFIHAAIAAVRRERAL